ncbi:hypothetical protein ACFFWC_21055 [Plantactinospora siamensis]|uniref:Gram-positive cocci surface proteins LPxTG domain-containing protein n=1 Tax=Plantactinospora siamensis TaxID=555372 RepID=A0ABV6NU68_9ACTN
MQQRRQVARVALCAAATTAALGLTTPGWAGAVGPVKAADGHNPKGDNGTVKIDGAPLDDKVDNQPHVACDFEIEFFNFDLNQRADITLTAQPPSGTGQVVLAITNRVISDDPASGAENDHDAVIPLSANDLRLIGLAAHPKQGYHLQLTVELTDGHGAGKHKVFWLQPCATDNSGGGTPSTDNPGGGTPPTDNPGGGTPPTDTPGSGAPTGGAGGGGGDTGGGSLPITGVAAGGIALGGTALIAGGVVLTLVRRRRITFTS